MLSQRTVRDSPGESSPDQSACSSDTGDVLIRSTRVRLQDRRPRPGSVQITVQKLRPPPVQPPQAEQQRSSGAEKRQQRSKPRQKPDSAAPQRAAGRALPDRLQKPTKENREPRGAASPPPHAAPAPDRKCSAGAHGEPQPSQTQPSQTPDHLTISHDLLTSRFAAGGRGAVLAALKQRSHSAPHRREVIVQLLDPGPPQTGSQPGPGPQTGSQPGPGPQTGSQHAAAAAGAQTATAAAAAAVAAAAPLIKAQSDLEARVSQLTEGVQKLLQADRDGVDRGRGLSQQRLQQLETLQSQQLQLQSQLMESALRMVSGPAPLTSDLAAAGQTARLQVTHLDAAAATMETGPVSMATPRHDRRPERTRGASFSRRAPIVSTQPAAASHLRSSANHSQVAARTANEALRETLLMQEDFLKTTRPDPDHHQSPQNQSPQNQSQQNQSQQNQTPQNQSQQNQSQFQQVRTEPNNLQSQSTLTEPQQTHPKSQQSPFYQTQSQQNQTHQTQSQLPQQSRSVLVQRRPVVPSMLEEAGQVLRQVQRQKKVLEENLESLLRARTGEVLHCQLEALAANRDWTEEVRIKKTVDAWINTLTRDIQAEMCSEDAAVTSQRAAGSSAHTGRGQPVNAHRGAGSKPAAGRGSRGRTAAHRPRAEPGPVGGESYLNRLYGRAPHDGQRRTLKKSPYLRFSSPASPLSRKPRPRLVESVKGVKLKSCKTQTCLAPPLTQHHDVTNPAHLTTGDPTDLTVTPAGTVSMAIPLGRPRMNSSSSRRLAELQQEVTSPPTAPPTSDVVARDDRTPELQSQLDAGEAPPFVEIIETQPEEEENFFPGNDFLSVADVIQQEELSAGGEEVLELDGGPSPPPVLYQGPVFPPQAPSALPAQDQASVPGLHLQRDALEDRMVEWVEQQLMSRMISEMYRPPPSDPALNNSTDQSECEQQSAASDIVEAAGGAGLQLFVDSNMSVDSALIRQLVHEVLTEEVALMLGQRDSQTPGPGPGTPQEDKLVPLVLTPEPTPPPSPAPQEEAPPLVTPSPSEPTSLLIDESPHPITAPEPVATPPSSPEPARSAGSPPAVPQAPPPLSWGDAELPLDEERPEEKQDTRPQRLVMSVAEEEPPLSSPLPPPSTTPHPSPPPGPDPDPDPDPGPGPGSGPGLSPSESSESSSSTVTAETETAVRHISEGELLVSVSQHAATEEDTVCSFSSSLQELQEMDFDPPSEGQVRGHDLLLTLLTKMEQIGERRPEGSWGRGQDEEVSVGEARDDRTTNPSSSRRRGQTSPGQISAGSDASFEATNQSSAALDQLTVEPAGTLTSDCQTDPSLSPPVPQNHTHTAEQQRGARRVEVHLPSIRQEEQEEEQEEEEQQQEEQEEEVRAADTDSSTDDLF